MTDFLEPQEQKLFRKVHKNRPQLFVAGPLILHDNARPHIAGVVTKTTWRLCVGSVTSCTLQSRHESTRLRLIPKVKRTRVDVFSSPEELSTDGTRAIRHVNKNGVLYRIIMLPKRWDSVIEKQGD